MSYKNPGIKSENATLRRSRAEGSLRKDPKSFKKAVSIAKVNFPIMQQWIEDTLHQQLPDDDIVADYVCELLQARDNPDIRSIHVQMSDFLGEKDLMEFCEKLWNALLSAQDDKDGIPRQLIDERSTQMDDLERKRGHNLPDDQPKEDKKTNYNRTQYNARKRPLQTTNRPYRDRDGSQGPKESRYGSSLDRDRDPRHTVARNTKSAPETANNAPKRPQNGLRNIYERHQH